MPSDLASLSAEEDGGAAINKRSGKGREPPAVHGDDWGRKRVKMSSVAVVTEVAEDGEEEKMKRARGRPRLDTKDQTAAEVGHAYFTLSNVVLLRDTPEYRLRNIETPECTIVASIFSDSYPCLCLVPLYHPSTCTGIQCDSFGDSSC